MDSLVSSQNPTPVKTPPGPRSEHVTQSRAVTFDNASFGTTTYILSGKKYWIFLYRDTNLPVDDDPRGDIGSTKWAPPFSQFYDHMFEGYFVAEAIEMAAGTILYVLP
jgi:hypothetical protein